MDILSVLTCLLIFGKHSLVLCDDVYNNGTHHYVTYQGFNEIVLSCNGSDVINITEVKLTSHVRSCPHQTCALSENDTLVIENCNDDSTCTVPVHDMSGCIAEKGFYNVRYACKTNALNCHFENNDCQIHQGSSGWKISKAKDAGDNYLDNSIQSGDGFFLYVKTGSNATTTLNNLIYSNPIQCLSFHHWMNEKNDDDDFITVHRVNNSGVIDTHYAKNNKRPWEKITVSFNDEGDYSLRFKASGHNKNSEFIIDDIKIINADCNEELPDRIEYNHTCRKIDEVTELQGCSKYYIENITSQFDPMEEKCQQKICKEFGDSIHCDLRPVVNSHPSCFNLNTLRINYTCNEKADVLVSEIEQTKNDVKNIGLVAGAVSGVLVVFMIFAVIFIICRRRSTKHGQKRNPTQTSGGSKSGYLPSNRQETASNLVVGPNTASHNHLYGQSHGTTSKQSQNKPIYYPEEAGVYENSQHVYALAAGVNQTQDDDYGESVAGIYDISGNNRHKVNDPIYSYDHSVDDTYDTSYQGRRDNPGNDTYNHMFGKQTEGDYEIAGS